MTMVELAIHDLHRSENDLACELLQVSDRHQADHEIFYLGRDLARWSQEHVRKLARVGRDRGLDLDDGVEDDRAVLATLRQKSSGLTGRRRDPGLVLLGDLREVHLKAVAVSLDWEVLAQTAQALEDRELLALAQDCHPQSLRQMRWANAQLKVSAAQVMVSA
jgi:hypothetical protein